MLALSKNVPDVQMLEAITREELVREQTDDPYCQSILHAINHGAILPFTEDETGALVRTVTVNYQLVVPEKLRPRLLHYAHHALLAGAPGGRKLYTTLRRDYYWPSMAVQCYQTVRNCSECAKNRIKLRRNASN